MLISTQRAHYIQSYIVTEHVPVISAICITGARSTFEINSGNGNDSLVPRSLFQWQTRFVKTQKQLQKTIMINSVDTCNGSVVRR